MDKGTKCINVIIDNKSARPRYLQVADGIVDAILAGRLPFGKRLRSTREAAILIGVNHKTIEMAIRLLSDEGILEKKARSGVYVKPVSAYVLGSFINKYKDFPIADTSVEKTDNETMSLEGHHGISVWIEWDTLGNRYIDSIKTELYRQGIDVDVIVSAGGHPAIRLDQGNMKSEEFSALVSALQHLTPDIASQNTYDL